MHRVTIDRHLISALMPDIVGHDRSPAAFIVYLFLTCSARGRRRQVQASLQSIADDTGLSKSAVQGAVRLLLRRRLLRQERAGPTAVPFYDVLKPWVRPARS
jgi:hypothetical protein